MTKSRSIADSANLDSIPGQNIKSETLSDQQISSSADISSQKLGFIRDEAQAVQRAVSSKLADTICVKDFGAVGDGSDATAAFNAAVAALGSGGGLIYIPAGRYLITSTVEILKNVILKGDGVSSVIEIADGVLAFRFGRTAPLGQEDQIINVLGGVRDLRFVGKTQIVGNVATTLGSSSPNFGFTTLNTSFGGCKDPFGNNASNEAVRVNGYRTPFDISGCEFLFLGRAIGFGGSYGLYIYNNRIRYCSIGIENVAYIPTTINIFNNTIERCAVGVFCKYPSSFIRIDHNVIEGNYAGCDIYLFNGPIDIEITRNYFEASPRNIVVRADSGLPFIAQNVLIERNTTVHLYVRTSACNNYVLRENWLGSIELNLYSNGTISNVILDNNYAGSIYEPFDPASIKLNSAAQQYANRIEYRGPCNNSVVKLDTASLYPLMTVKSRKFLRNVTGTGPATAFSVSVPAAACAAAFAITGYRFGSSAPIKAVEWEAGINRLSESISCTAAAVVDKDLDIPVLGGASQILPTPTVTITGGATETQTVTFNLLSGNSGGEAGSWSFEVKVTATNAAIDFV